MCGSENSQRQRSLNPSQRYHPWVTLKTGSHVTSQKVIPLLGRHENRSQKSKLSFLDNHHGMVYG